MIPEAHVHHWGTTHAPWVRPEFVEHDLILSRCLVELFSTPAIASRVNLRGGTALNKLFLQTNARFSEDIDLVQSEAEDNGPLIDAIRKRLDPLFGAAPKRKIGQGLTTLTYRFVSNEGTTLKLKIETNTREHRSLFPIRAFPFSVDSPWFQGAATVSSFCLEELLGTKLRALYQRRKGRDLYDFWAVGRECEFDSLRIVSAFHHYISMQGLEILKSDFEKNLENKVEDALFRDDMPPLLQSGVSYEVHEAYSWFCDAILLHWKDD